VTADELVRAYLFSARRGERGVFSTFPTTGEGEADFDTMLELYDLEHWKQLAKDDDGSEGPTSLPA